MNNPKNDLAKIYNNYLIEYKKTGQKPHPARLLLLLLKEKNNFFPFMIETGDFYNFYKNRIDSQINKVITDFQITKEEIIFYIEKTGYFYKEEDYEYDKIWRVFLDGFDLMHGSIMYTRDLTQEEVYQKYENYFDDEQLNPPKNISKSKIKKKNNK